MTSRERYGGVLIRQVDPGYEVKDRETGLTLVVTTDSAVFSRSNATLFITKQGYEAMASRAKPNGPPTVSPFEPFSGPNP